MKKFAIIAALAVAGCEPTVDPAVQRLDDACASGDMKACADVATIRQNARAAMPPFTIAPMDPAPFMNERPQTSPQMKVCPNGLIVPVYNFC